MDKVQGRVSVITATCNRSQEIVKRCIGCVNCQTYRNWEHLICADGTPGWQEGLEHCHVGGKRQFLSTVERTGDYGQAARNFALEQARGEYVCFYDDDNLIIPEYLEIMVKGLEAAGSGIGMAICRIVHFGPLNENVWPEPPQVLSGVPPRLYRIDTLQVMFRMELFRQFQWRSDDGYCADGLLFERIAKETEYVIVPQCLGFHM